MGPELSSYDIPVFQLSSQPGSLSVNSNGKISSLEDEGASPAAGRPPLGLELPEVIFHAPTAELV